jgi:signal transduction histidine kinase
MFQMLILVGVAFFVGHRVDREATARRKAEVAGEVMRTYAANVVNAQEEERQHVARELHDQTVQTLVMLCRKLDSIGTEEHLSSPIIEELYKARAMSEEAVASLRNFARDLRPPALDDLGLSASLNKLLLDFGTRSRIKTSFNVTGGETRLSPDAEVGMFRIAQEALRNVERHSRANEVDMTVTFYGNGTAMEIRDDGVGFTASLADFPSAGHLGLLGMKERAALLGGEVEIQSAPGRGTAVTVSIRA